MCLQERQILESRKKTFKISSKNHWKSELRRFQNCASQPETRRSRGAILTILENSCICIYQDQCLIKRNNVSNEQPIRSQGMLRQALDIYNENQKTLKQEKNFQNKIKTFKSPMSIRHRSFAILTNPFCLIFDLISV